MKNKEAKPLICVNCGTKWPLFGTNCTKCKGSCTWGFEPNSPENFTVDADGNWHLKPPPKKTSKK